MSDYQKDPLPTAKHHDTVADYWNRWRSGLTTEERKNVCDYSFSQCNCARLHYK